LLVLVLSVGERYLPPAPDSEAGLALAAQMERECGTDPGDPLALLCREQIASEREWAYYRGRIAESNVTWLLLIGLGAVALLLTPWTWRWLREGFRQEES